MDSYDRAYRLLLFPLQQLNNPLGRVMLPLLSRLRDEPDRYRKAYEDCISLLMTVSQPGLVFLVVNAEEVFALLFGPRWLPAASIFRWLGVVGLVQVMSTTGGWLFMSQGRGGEYFRNGVINACIMVAAFVVGLPWGALGVAIAYTFSVYALNAPISWWNVGRHGPVSTRDLVRVAAPHGLASAVAAVCEWINATYHPFSTAPEIVGLLAAAALSYLSYLVVILGFPRKRELFLRYWPVVVSLLSAARVRPS